MNEVKTWMYERGYNQGMHDGVFKVCGFGRGQVGKSRRGKLTVRNAGESENRLFVASQAAG